MHTDGLAPLSFSGRVAVVTGGGGGLGRAYSQLLARLGASVVVNDVGASLDGRGLDGDPASRVVDEIRAHGGVALANHSDISDPEQAHALIDEAVAHFGRLDVLVTNAGIVRREPFASTSAASLKAHLDVHLNGTFYPCRAAWSTMSEQQYGRIVTIVSSALFGIEGVAAYATAKGGIWGLTKAMAVEGAAQGIKVNAVAPIAYTRMTASGAAGANPDAQTAPALAPERVAATVAVLAHEQCPTTGEAYLASGTHVSRIFMGETKGVTSDDISADALLAQWESVVDASTFEIPTPRAEGSTTLQAAGQSQSEPRT